MAKRKPDAVARLGAALSAAGAVVTLDPGRNNTNPCTFCGRPPHRGAFHLRDIGRYPDGDTITRPVCEGCSHLAEPHERGLSQVKLVEGLPLPPKVLGRVAFALNFLCDLRASSCADNAELDGAIEALDRLGKE